MPPRSHVSDSPETEMLLKRTRNMSLVRATTNAKITPKHFLFSINFHVNSFLPFGRLAVLKISFFFIGCSNLGEKNISHL